jgi:hypothetical protein
MRERMGTLRGCLDVQPTPGGDAILTASAPTQRRERPSESTVKSHITNTLTKLHLAGRTQAAVYARQKGIVRRDRE